MAWAKREHSKSQVDKSGSILADQSSLHLERDAALQVVANWRACHSWPLNTLKTGLLAKATTIDRKSIVAQRLKRLTSIESKLCRGSTRLSQMQDIGGCRAVVSTAAKVDALVQSYLKSDLKHKLLPVADYLRFPRSSGYRGVHLIYSYYSDRNDTYNGLSVEMQLRSLLQHAWATAVETIDTFKHFSLKSETGPPDWQRFFALMGTYIALREGTVPVPGTPATRRALRSELIHHAKLIQVESQINIFALATENFGAKRRPPEHYHFILHLDAPKKRLTITSFHKKALKEAESTLLGIERNLNPEFEQAVLVSAKSMADLRRSFPNYFGDTRLFARTLQEAMGLAADQTWKL